MTNTNGASADPQIQEIRDSLGPYADAHSNAEIDVRRRNSVSLRIRIIDPDFASIDRVDRETPIWRLLEELPDSVLSNITMLLLLTPEEAPDSFANREFEDPLPPLL